MISSGSATWRGSWHHGEGTISTASETIQGLPFSYASRFEDKPGGNPEELFAAAYAGCPYSGSREHLGLGKLGDRKDRDYGTGRARNG